MGRILEISASSFGKIVLRSDKPVVVIARAIDALRNEENRHLAFHRGVRSVPTLEVFYRGRHIGNVVGCHELDTLVEAIKDFIAKKAKYIGPSTPLDFSPSVT